MMGSKERAFAPLPPVTLEDLVPPDHFYRHLERTLDLALRARPGPRRLRRDRAGPPSTRSSSSSCS